MGPGGGALVGCGYTPLLAIREVLYTGAGLGDDAGLIGVPLEGMLWRVSWKAR